ncbi:MAG: hypothetical protein GEU26_00950 [Nitrososphaeraceae archaeon]|nr:hypothetical protein [Nitrososphaeraceae archaeon]
MDVFTRAKSHISAGRRVSNPFRLVLICLPLIILGFASTNVAFSHLEHLPHYNGGFSGVGKYYIFQGMEPDYPRPGEPAGIVFSIQDNKGNDMTNIVTMVEIYDEKSGDRIAVFPWTKHDVGDFRLYYTFPRVGNYILVVSVVDDSPASENRIGLASPARSTLLDSSDCDCERGLMNISVTNNFGTIYYGSIFAGIFMGIAVLGMVLAFMFLKRRKTIMSANIKDKQVLKYCILFLAMASGFVHIAVFPGHASLRIEYSIFLFAAGAAQFAYGIVYVLISLNESKISNDMSAVRSRYKKTAVLNMFGLIGSSVLLGLYLYSVILPPPLSPNNIAEQVEVAGVLAKSTEAILVGGMVYLMIWERRRFRSEVIRYQQQSRSQV